MSKNVIVLNKIIGRTFCVSEIAYKKMMEDSALSKSTKLIGDADAYGKLKKTPPNGEPGAPKNEGPGIVVTVPKVESNTPESNEPTNKPGESEKEAESIKEEGHAFDETTDSPDDDEIE